MPCKDQWITRDGKVIDMHDMTDDHILDAYALLDEAKQEAEYDGRTEESYDLGESTAQLECEAERRWDCPDGETEIQGRLRKRKARSGPPQAPIVGKKQGA